MTIVRLPPVLLDRAKKAAAEKGMSLNDLLVQTLDRQLGGDGDPTIDFLNAIRAWLQDCYGENFPADVTLRTFDHIRGTPALFAAYNACVIDARGKPDSKLLNGLHRRIGLMVKRTFRAEAYGSSLPLTSPDRLISSYRLLRSPKLSVGKSYWRESSFPPQAKRLVLPDGRVLDDAVVWPDFCQDELDIDPDHLWRELMALPVWPSDKKIQFRQSGDHPQWITGKNKALKYRGHELKRAKIWFQSDYQKGMLRYGYSGWQYGISFATHAVEYAPPLTQQLIKRLNDGLTRSGQQPHNHWIATRYDSKDDNIGMHSDKDKDFTTDSFFIVIKFGAPRRFAFQLPGISRPFYNEILTAGTAVFVRCKSAGAANDLVQHGVPETDENVGPSGSIVSRCIKTVKPWDVIKREVEKRANKQAKSSNG